MSFHSLEPLQTEWRCCLADLHKGIIIISYHPVVVCENYNSLMCIHVLLQFRLVTSDCRSYACILQVRIYTCYLSPGWGGSTRGDWGDRRPLKPTKMTLFAMILCNSERHLTAN